jgi:hypothetical protein
MSPNAQNNTGCVAFLWNVPGIAWLDQHFGSSGILWIMHWNSMVSGRMMGGVAGFVYMKQLVRNAKGIVELCTCKYKKQFMDNPQNRINITWGVHRNSQALPAGTGRLSIQERVP